MLWVYEPGGDSSCQQTPALQSLCTPGAGTHNVLEEVDYRVFILGPLRLLGQGAIVGRSCCVM